MNSLEIKCGNKKESVEIFYDRLLSNKIRIKISDKKGNTHTRYLEINKGVFND